MLYKLFSTKVDQHYLQLLHRYKRRHTSYPSRFFFMADGPMHCVCVTTKASEPLLLETNHNFQAKGNEKELPSECYTKNAL